MKLTCRRLRTKRRNKFACSKISTSPCCLLWFSREHNASTYDISAERNVWLQSALRSFAIVCDYMETGLFAIVCDLRSAIRDRLRSFAIIWKPALKEVRVLVNALSVVKSFYFYTKISRLIKKPNLLYKKRVRKINGYSLYTVISENILYSILRKKRGSLKAGFHMIANDRGSQTIAKRPVSI